MADTDPINWLLLVELLVVVIVASAFLFYWNRLVASIFAFFVRLVTWRYYNAYISIGSLQISPLAGRISFRDIEYHSSNLSFRALHGHLTFRYWWWRVRQEGDSQSNNTKRAKLPCRISCYAEGVEGFVYNRTPAYDEIVERMMKHEQMAGSSSSSTSTSGIGTGVESKPRARLRKVYKDVRGQKEDLLETSSMASATASNGYAYPPKPSELPNVPRPVKQPQPQSEGVDWFREALPMELRIVTGSIVLGSDATPMVLIGDFKRAEGVVEVAESRSACDKYKLSIDLSFQDPKVLMRTNVDWSGPSLAHGKKVYDELLKQNPDLAKEPPSSISTRLGFRLLARRFPFLRNPKFSAPPVPGLPTDKVWRGLARYRVENEDSPKPRQREEREYAKVTTLLESPALDFTYYADSPGPVPDPSEADYIDETDELGNVDLPPEYGIDIMIHGGIVKYGPWADRQRDALQRAFAPSIFFDTEPKPRLSPGDTRLHSTLILNLQLTEDTTLRIPTREPSKDWIYDNLSTEVERRYGWLDVTTGANSSIVYTQAQWATRHGYDAMLVLHLDSLEIASSVNLQSFIKAKACKLSMTMPTPLRWDAQRDWGFDLTLESPDITLLRDHVTLISDLAKDWSSGSQGDFHHFVPNHYNFRINMLNYAFHLYLNDYNIVDRPQSRDDNAIMDVYGPQMVSHVAVAATQYRPEFSVVPFSVDLKDARVMLCVPKWDTHRAFGDYEGAGKVDGDGSGDGAGECDSFEVGKIGSVSAKGSYRYYSSARPDHQENLTLHLEGRRVAFKALGWVLRRMFCVKDNYFGAFTQFTTMQEYLERFDHDPDSVGDSVEDKYRPGRSDPFTVQVTMNVEESLIVTSDEIYGCHSGLVMPVPQLQMSLKSTEHFMEMTLDATPTFITASTDLEKVYANGFAPPVGSDAVFIEGITLKAYRLFGPQPRATTYLCLWEAIIPNMAAFVSPAFASTLQSSVQAILYNFEDPDNAPASIYVPKTPPDVTFFKLSLDSASAMLRAGDSAISIGLPSGVNLDTSTLATRTCRSVLGVLIPLISIDLLSRHPGKKWFPTGSIRTGISLDLYKAAKGWRRSASEQQEFIQEEDRPTQRIWYMYREGEEMGNGHHVNGAYLPRPRVIGHDASDDETESEEEVFVQTSEASSDDGETVPRPKLRRRVKSFTTAKETLRAYSSSEEESDTTSSGTSSSSDDSDVHGDMAAVLYAKLRRLRSIRSLPVPDEDGQDDQEGPEAPKCGVPTSFDEGVILRVTTQRVDVDFDLASVHCASDIAQAMKDMDVPPEQLLDALLIGQADSVLEAKTSKVPFVVDGSIPLIAVRASTSAEKPISIVEASVSRLAWNLQKTPLEDEGSGIAFTSHVGRFEVVAVSPKPTDISLLDVQQQAALSTSGIPLLHLSGERLYVGFHEDGARQIRACGTFDIQTVTPTIPLVADTAQAWEQAFAAVPSSVPGPSRTAALLHSILRETSGSVSAARMPAFASESAYALHVEDQRNIRRDLGWWLISRLRHWLRTGGRGHRVGSAIDDASSRLTPEAFIAQLAVLDDVGGATEALVRQQHFIKHAYGPELAGPSATKTLHQTSAFVTAGITLRHHGRLLGSEAVGTSFVRLEKASLGVNTSSVKDVQQLRLLVAVQELSAEVQNSFLSASRHILSAVQAAPAKQPNPNKPSTEAQAFLIETHIGNGDLSVIAGGLRLRVGLAKAQHSLTVRPRRADGRISKLSSTAAADLIDVSLLALLDGGSERVALSAKLNRLRAGVEAQCTLPERVLRLTIGAQSIEFDSRPQLKAFLSFAQEWKDRHYQHYRPIIEELGGIASRRATPECETLSTTVILDVLVGSAQLQIRAAKAVWLRWEMGKIYVSRQGHAQNLSFGVRIAPQTVGAYSSYKQTKTKDVPMLRLPSITAIGSAKEEGGRPFISAKIDLGFFVGVLKPAVLDRLLSLHQRLGSDIMDVVRDYHAGIQKAFKSRHAKGVSSASAASDTSPSSPPGATKMLMDLHLSVAGVRFGLRADDVATTILLEALSLKGHLTNKSTKDAAVLWRAKVDHFGLSLGHLGGSPLSSDAEPMRKYRSAYMVLDLEAHEIPGAARAASHISLSLNRVHTVMHVAALSELSDLIKSWSADLQALNDSRAAEVAEVKQQTTKILKKIESAERGSQPEASWFATRLLSIEVTGLGIAIPLTNSIGKSNESASAPVPALLFSIRVMSFQNRRNETARFRVKQMALQFLHKFDQGVPEHFAGDFHPTRNRMSLPSIDAQAQMASKPDVWHLSAHCSATDFKLSLAPDVADGIFQLIDLYAHGRDHITHLEKHYRSDSRREESTASAISAAKHPDDASPITARSSQRIMVRLSFTFKSGLVEVHRTAEEDARTFVPDIRGRPSRVGWHDNFTLPSISVWMDYAGADALQSEGNLVFNAAVHESRNVLRPSILPFFVELASRIERRIKEKTPTSPHLQSAASVPSTQAVAVASDGPRSALHEAQPSESAIQALTRASGKVHLRVTLRIDRSELRLSCAPDSNAYVDLKWESGGFLASTTLSGQGVTSVAGSISGVTAYLSHEFAEQDRSCVEAGSKDMVFSITYNPAWRDQTRGLSVVVDTQISTHFRLEAFSAWLIFTSVWIDNAPNIDLAIRAGAEMPTPHPPVQTSKLGIAVLARIRTIDFDADIAVSRAKLQITPIVLSTLADGEQTKVDLKLGVTQVTARGDISGDIRSASLVFSTARRSSRASAHTDPTVLAMSIHGGDLNGNLFLGDVNIVRFHLEPSDVSLVDDWRAFTQDPSQQVFLSFEVKAGLLQGVVRLLAIPRLLGNFYSIFDLVESQQKIASQRSDSFKNRQIRKATEPSPMASAILHTVQHRAHPSSNGASSHIKTAQTMRFDLSGINVGVFNDDYDRGQISDFYRFVVGKVEADLQRQLSKEGLPKRDLKLLATYVRWDTSDGQRAAAEERREMTASEMIERAVRYGKREVASLPSMNLTMSSIEYPGPPTLEYDFDLVWGETDGDVAILPNFFEQAFRAFQKLMRGLDDQELARGRRLGTVVPTTPRKAHTKEEIEERKRQQQATEPLRYRRRNATTAGAMPIPRLKLLGEGTTDAAKLVPKIKSAVNELPSMSHRFVTLPLEEGMDMLLKLYEKQLPDRTT